MTEAELLAEILERCEGRDLWPVRLPTERRANRIACNLGFPDLAIYGPADPGVIYRELKTDRAGRVLRPSQTIWKHRLISGGHDWDIWTPGDLRSGLIDDELDELATPDFTDDIDDAKRQFSLAMAQD